MEWRDIKTAPKDGTGVDIWAHNGRVSEGARIPDVEWVDDFGWLDGFGCVWGRDEREIVSHWMPLPEPPKAEGE